MQVIHMSIMYNKQRNELHISVYMKALCIIMENYIMHVYLNIHIYIHERIINIYMRVLFTYKKRILLYDLYKGHYIKSMP